LGQIIAAGSTVYDVLNPVAYRLMGEQPTLDLFTPDATAYMRVIPGRTAARYISPC